MELWTTASLYGNNSIRALDYLTPVAFEHAAVGRAKAVSTAPKKSDGVTSQLGLCRHAPGIYRSFSARMQGVGFGCLMATGAAAIGAFRPLNRSLGLLPSIPYPVRLRCD